MQSALTYRWCVEEPPCRASLTPVCQGNRTTDIAWQLGDRQPVHYVAFQAPWWLVQAWSLNLRTTMKVSKRKKIVQANIYVSFHLQEKKRKISLVSWSLLSTTVEDEKNKYFLNKEHTTTYNAFDILRLGFTDHLP